MAEKLEPIASNESSAKTTEDHLTPPHTCSAAWIDRLLEGVRDLNPGQITREFVTANVVASGHEGKVLKASRFLGLVDENGNVTPRLRALRVVGPEFTSNLAIVVQKAYSDLFSTISIKSATFGRLVNFLMQKYSMGQPQAESAARFFIHLASRAGMDLNEDLLKPTGLKHEKDRTDSSPKTVSLRKDQPHVDTRRDDIGALAIIDGPFGRIRILDEPTLELARRALDMVGEKVKRKE